jgi:hypothetical protein
VHSVREDREEALQDPVPVFWVDRLREIHRALEVSEEDRDLLAFALEGAARCENLFGEVFRRVGARIGRFDSGGGLLSKAVAARVAEAILR